jgi:hypothetical protein
MKGAKASFPWEASLFWPESSTSMESNSAFTNAFSHHETNSTIIKLEFGKLAVTELKSKQWKGFPYSTEPVA